MSYRFVYLLTMNPPTCFYATECECFLLLFLLQKPSFSHICGFCAKKNAVLIEFSIIMLSELIFNYDSIHVYQENPAIQYL